MKWKVIIDRLKSVVNGELIQESVKLASSTICEKYYVQCYRGKTQNPSWPPLTDVYYYYFMLHEPIFVWRKMRDHFNLLLLLLLFCYINLYLFGGR